METPATIGTGAEYYPVPGSESDDTQSFASHSDGNDNLPCIIYTSDDSADIIQPALNYVDSDLSLIAHNVNQQMGDEISQQFLLESEQTSPQMSPQPEDPFISHPLSPVQFVPEDQHEDIGVAHGSFIPRNTLFADSGVQDPNGLLRSTSSSSTETESTPDGNPFLSEYEPLPLYPEDENYSGGLNFDVLQEDPIKTRVLQDHLNLMAAGDKGITADITTNCKRWYVGNVHIDAGFKDVSFVSWNWVRIRQTCAFIHVSFLISLLCAGVALLVQMPQGSDCDPARQWWQGSVAYHIFVPSFQDSNGDGFGDIKGIVSRLDYLSDLGVKVVRLAPIFESESFFATPSSPLNYTTVMATLGDIDDLHLLSLLLHERHMFLMLDVPLSKGGTLGSLDASERNASHAAEASIDLLRDVPSIISNWTRLGVDGFFFADLDRLAHQEDLLPAIQKWRNALDVESSGLHHRVMAVPVTLIKQLEGVASEAQLHHLLSIVDMIDAHVGLSPSVEQIGALINDVTRWSDHPSRPWVSWSLGGGVGRPRLLEQMSPSADGASLADSRITTIGPLILQLYLPGSVSLFYGDEIALGDSHLEDFGWASPMIWTNGSKNGGFSSGQPWIPVSANWKVKNVAALHHHLEPLRIMIKATQEEVPMYINGISSFENGPKQRPNYVIRMAGKKLLILERFYPRRNTFTVVFNLGAEKEEGNLSKFYYGGRVLASSHGKEGYIYFRNISLLPGEALACILDK